MKKIILFDLDGTIINYGCKIDDEMIQYILNVKKLGYEIGVVSERRLEGIMNLSRNFIFGHIFSECGSVYNLYNGYTFKQIYKNNIKNHKTYNQINLLIKTALDFISKVDYSISGHLIDIRNGLIYISLIGAQASDNERNTFIETDKDKNYTIKLLDILKKMIDDTKLSDDIYVGKGGMTGIVIYPREWNKSQVVDYLKDYDEIVFLGNSYEKSENDYEIITHSKIKGYKINSIEEIKQLLITYSKK